MNIPTKEFGKKSTEEIFKITKSSSKGLTNQEAIERSKIFGLNEITKKKKMSAIVKFLQYFENPLILILLGAAILTGIVGEIKNCIIIIVMILFSVVLNFVQEHKSNKAAEKIVKKISLYCKALRNRKERVMRVRYLVQGDIIMLSAGDIIPADGVVLESNNFFVNESAFTGESYPVEKDDKKNKIIFSGAPVVSGFAKCIVTNIGLNTEFGKITLKLYENEEENAFEKGIKNFGYFLIKIIIAIVFVIFIINIATHKNLFESVIFSIAVAVGITPELLPMIMSVNMAKGSINMSKKGVLVKRLDAIPDFGSMDILCTDKTGTLTEDRIALVKFLNVNGQEDKETLKFGYINAH